MSFLSAQDQLDTFLNIVGDQLLKLWVTFSPIFEVVGDISPMTPMVATPLNYTCILPTQAMISLISAFGVTITWFDSIKLHILESFEQ